MTTLTSTSEARETQALIGEHTRDALVIPYNSGTVVLIDAPCDCGENHCTGIIFTLTVTDEGTLDADGLTVAYALDGDTLLLSPADIRKLLDREADEAYMPSPEAYATARAVHAIDAVRDWYDAHSGEEG